MKKLSVFLAAAALLTAACTPTEQSTAVGALGGAAVGAAVSGPGDKTKGAIVGGALGAVAGSLIGKANEPGKCYYNDGYGNRYIAPC
ncbi:MAG: glycine zipper 2TM domain-containing protein [Rhodobacter sp.]|nr:glycine zipper 2TM domain-containing protein [Rhodobacter sp.]